VAIGNIQKMPCPNLLRESIDKTPRMLSRVEIRTTQKLMKRMLMVLEITAITIQNQLTSKLSL
jgi:hypothetical protein